MKIASKYQMCFPYLKLLITKAVAKKPSSFVKHQNDQNDGKNKDDQMDKK